MDNNSDYVFSAPRVFSVWFFNLFGNYQDGYLMSFSHVSRWKLLCEEAEMLAAIPSAQVVRQLLTKAVIAPQCILVNERVYQGCLQGGL